MLILNEVYTVLKARLKELTEVKKVDWYNEQYQNTEDEKATRYPAVYVEFLEPINWRQSGDKFQLADCTIKLHIVVYDILDSPLRTLQVAQAIFEHINSKGLYDGAKQLTTELVRSSSSFPKRYNQLKVVEMNFDFEVFDVSGMPMVTPVSPTFIIN